MIFLPYRPPLVQQVVEPQIQEEQYDFNPGRGTLYQLFTLKYPYV